MVLAVVRCSMRSSATAPGRCSRRRWRAEVAAYIDAHAGEVDENGHRLVVRNGCHHEREVLTAAGAVTVTAPRVNDKPCRSPIPVSGNGSPRRSCRLGRASHRR